MAIYVNQEDPAVVYRKVSSCHKDDVDSGASICVICGSGIPLGSNLLTSEFLCLALIERGFHKAPTDVTQNKTVGHEASCGAAA
jgi:hypothetical protein